MPLARSPLAPSAAPELPPVDGVQLAATACGIRYQSRTDLMLVVMDEGTSVGGVFTRSKTASAPVEWCRANVAQGKARALVVNSGNSNAFTGKLGVASVERTVNSAAALAGCKPEEVFVASTGVIGEPLPDLKITDALPDLARQLSPSAWEAAASAIMTTDTFMKVATRSLTIDGETITINGMAKGSGMIAPDMATMLAFVFTDAAIAAPVLQVMTQQANLVSFNSITVDGDTSTSDTALCFATGKKLAARPITSAEEPRAKQFTEAYDALMIELAQLIVRDGEGASKFVTVEVNGAEDDAAARRIGLSIANSPLVKTAVAGEDANWGRIVMAVGKTGEKVDRDRLEIRIGGTLIAKDGQRVDGYDEAPVNAHMKGSDIALQVALGIGPGRAVVWTCDLTHGYIDINGSYRS